MEIWEVFRNTMSILYWIFTKRLGCVSNWEGLNPPLDRSRRCAPWLLNKGSKCYSIFKTFKNCMRTYFSNLIITTFSFKLALSKFTFFYRILFHSINIDVLLPWELTYKLILKVKFLSADCTKIHTS